MATSWVKRGYKKKERKKKQNGRAIFKMGTKLLKSDGTEHQ